MTKEKLILSTLQYKLSVPTENYFVVEENKLSCWFLTSLNLVKNVY